MERVGLPLDYDERIQFSSGSDPTPDFSSFQSEEEEVIGMRSNKDPKLKTSSSQSQRPLTMEGGKLILYDFEPYKVVKVVVTVQEEWQKWNQGKALKPLVYGELVEGTSSRRNSALLPLS